MEEEFEFAKFSEALHESCVEWIGKGNYLCQSVFYKPDKFAACPLAILALRNDCKADEREILQWLTHNSNVSIYWLINFLAGFDNYILLPKSSLPNSPSYLLGISFRKEFDAFIV